MRRTPLVAVALLAAVAGQAAPTTKSSGISATETAIFAGGCFWCTEADFDKVPGVVSTTSGYIGGTVVRPSYEQVSAGGTGHYEAVRVVYDPKRISYAQLVDRFWPMIDPTDAGGQFCDRGDSYRSAIFVTPEQRATAEASKARLAERGVLAAPIVTSVLPAKAFYPAEGYHQDYYKKNPIRYRFYRFSCGRDARLDTVWQEAKQASR
jgi:peptide-methionine (S)-S-oxide reductase